MYVFAGHNGKEALNDLYIYDTGAPVALARSCPRSRRRSRSWSWSWWLQGRGRGRGCCRVQGHSRWGPAVARRRSQEQLVAAQHGGGHTAGAVAQLCDGHGAWLCVSACVCARATRVWGRSRARACNMWKCDPPRNHGPQWQRISAAAAPLPHPAPSHTHAVCRVCALAPDPTCRATCGLTPTRRPPGPLGAVRAGWQRRL